MTAPESVVQAAIAQIEQGFAVFALRADAKVPITERGFKNATTKPEWIRTQLEAPPAGNYGLVWPEDAPWPVVVFDLDDGGGAERPWRDRLLDLIAIHGPLPATKSTTTPSGGRHVFYRWPAGVPIPPGDELFGFTVRWPGRGYLVGPGSSIGGREYVPGPETAIAELPAPWVYAAIAEHPPSRAPSGNGVITITGGFELPQRIPSGRRYATVRDYVASRYNAGLGLEELWELVRSQVAPRFETPKTEAELRADFDRVTVKLSERLGPPRNAGQVEGAIAAVTTLEDAALTEFDSRPIEWLWQAWLPRGVVTLMDGNPGVSKSTLVADLVARITTGREWPDETPAERGPGRVIWITTEDDPGRVLRPRIEAAGGDARLVRFVTSEVVFPGAAAAFAELLVKRASEPEGLELVILDPLFSHIDAKVKSIADADMRQGVMNPLNRAAEAANVAVLVVRHFNKDTGASAINRGAGSLGGIVGAARALWSVALDPEDESGETKAVGVSKLNYARTKPALRYRVVDRLPPGWISGSVSGIEWLGESKVPMSILMTEDSSVGDAVQALQELLEAGPVAAKPVQDKMRSRGFGRDATRSAKSRLGVVVSKTGFGGGWEWSLPPSEESGSSTQPDSSDSSDPSKNRAPDSSDSSQPRGRARARSALEPDSSDSSKNRAGPEESEESGGGAPPAPAPLPARAREDPTVTPVLVPEDAALVPVSSWCLFFVDHQSRHRDTQTNQPWCEICSPKEES